MSSRFGHPEYRLSGAVGSQIGAFRMGKDSKPKMEKHSKHKKKGSKEKKAKQEKHSKQRRRSSSPSDSSSGSDGERLGVNKQLAMGRAAARATREILAYNHDLRKELREVRWRQQAAGGGRRLKHTSGVPALSISQQA